MLTERRLAAGAHFAAPFSCALVYSRCIKNSGKTNVGFYSVQHVQHLVARIRRHG
jgi:hypothetical protein